MFGPDAQLPKPLLAAALSWIVFAAQLSLCQGQVVSRPQSAPGDFGISQVGLINEHIRRTWNERELRPSPPATDGEWCRRVYLDLVGRVPTVDELQEYLDDRSRDRRRQLVERLLGSEYREPFARHWTNVWTNILIGRTGGTTRDSLSSREGMQTYLREAFSSDKPYDRLVYELITATGSCRPGEADFNGAANYLADKLAEEGVQATAQTAQLFAGMAVQCTQCHNHPFNEAKQNQFWELNAFFRQTAVERLPGMDRRNVRIVDRDFPGEGRSEHWTRASGFILEQSGGKLVDSQAAARAAAPTYYELRNGTLKMAFPVFLDGTELAHKLAERGNQFGQSGFLEHVNRRQELAKLVIESPRLERALVNRMWARFLGHGFTKPIHDMRPDNPPSHPELLDGLAREFRDAEFNLRELMRWIVLSEPYALSSRTIAHNEADDPQLGGPPMFSHFYVRQMEAEQLYESLLVATAADDAVPAEAREQTRQQWLNQFNTAFGTDENDEATTFNGSIPQALMMMNGPLVQRATAAVSDSMLARVARNASLTNPEKMRYLYQAALSREPTREELHLSNQILAARGGNVVAALEDVWWALLNSNEFILIH